MEYQNYKQLYFSFPCNTRVFFYDVSLGYILTIVFVPIRICMKWVILGYTMNYYGYMESYNIFCLFYYITLQDRNAICTPLPCVVYICYRSMASWRTSVYLRIYAFVRQMLIIVRRVHFFRSNVTQHQQNRLWIAFGVPGIFKQNI